MRIVGNDPTLSRQITATASGAISAAGKPLIVNTDGTVAVAGDIAPSAGSEAVILSNDVGGYSSLIYAGDNTQTTNDADKVIIVFKDPTNSNYGTAVVGTVSGTSISFGSKVVFESAEISPVVCCMDSTQGKVGIFYQDNGNSHYGTGVVGTVSGTSISFGTPSVFESANTIHLSCDFDDATGKILVGYADFGNSGHGTAIVATISGTSLSYGSAAVFNAANTQKVSVAYDPNANRFLISYRDLGNSNYGEAVVATISSTSVSYGSAVVFSSANTDHVTSICDTTNNKVVVGYNVSGINKAIVGTLDASSTDVSFGSEATVHTNTAYFHSNRGLAYDPDTGRVLAAYLDSTDASHGKIALGTVSGTSISFDTPFKFNAGTTYYVGAAYNKGTDNFVVIFEDYGNSGYLTSIVIDGGGNNLTTENFIGTSAHLAADGAKVLVNTQGAIDENQSGLTAGQTFFVDKNGALQLTTNVSEARGTAVVFEEANSKDCCVAFDSSNNKVVIAYQDGGDSNKGKAIVGTVDSSDNSISFGSAAEFASSIAIGDPDIVAITFDSNANKVVIVFKDGSNNGNAIVGTVSGTSISFGSAAAFNSANTSNIGCTFDSSNNKVVITYQDAGNSYYGTAIVGTVSGTDITFGSEAVFNSATTYEIGVTFDSSNNKVAIFYKDAGNSEHGYGKVGTVSGTSISYGSATEFNDAVTSYIFAGFDSSNNKVIVAYQDSHDGSGGRAKVATISGTSISFGSEATFNSGATLHPQIAFDSNVNKVIIMYEDDANSDYGTYVVGTVSGTSISFGSEIVFEAAAVEDLGIAFDSNANRMVMVYQDQGNSNYGTAIVQQSANDLSGSLSTDAVTAGTALSATKLLVKG